MKRYSHLFYGQVVMSAPTDDEAFLIADPNDWFAMVDSDGEEVSARKRSLELLPEEPVIPDSHGNLNALASEITKNNVAKGFYQPGVERNFGETIALITSELSEALEHSRDGRAPGEVWYDEKGKIDGVGVEIADAIIRCLGWAGENDIDIDRLVAEKMAYNATREFLHGRTY